MTFKIGQMAVYPAHGVVEVLGVDTKQIAGQPFHSATNVLPMKRRSSTPILLDQKPEATRSRMSVKNAAPGSMPGFAFAGQAMSSRICRRWASDAATNDRAKRLRDSWFSQARPPRIASLVLVLASASASSQSMNSGTFASVALPDRASRGMM